MTGVEGYPYPVASGSNDMFGGGGLSALLIGSLLFGGGMGGFGNRGLGMNGVGMGAGGYVGGVVEGGQSAGITALQGQISALASNVSQQAIHTEISEVEAGLGSTNSNLNALGRDIISGQGNINTNIATGNFTTLSSINGLGRDVIASQNQSSLQALNSSNQLNTSVLQGFNSTNANTLQGFNALNTTFLQGINELGRDTLNATNLILAGQAAAQAAAAACCCDLKTTILNDGNATRALVNSLYVQELQGQLSDAKNQNSTLAQTITTQNIANQQTGVILSHLAARPVVV